MLSVCATVGIGAPDRFPTLLSAARPLITGRCRLLELCGSYLSGIPNLPEMGRAQLCANPENLARVAETLGAVMTSSRQTLSTARGPNHFTGGTPPLLPDEASANGMPGDND